MKRALIFFVVLLALNAGATITVTNFGNTGNGTSATTFAVSPNATFNAGSGVMGVIVYAIKNSGGASKVFTQTTFNDSVGNTWTQRLDAVYNPSGANTGVEIAAYTAPIGTTLHTTDNITITLSTSTGAKAAGMYGVSGISAYFVTAGVLSDGLTSGQNGTAVSVTSTSISTGDVIIAFCGADTATTTTGSSDTTNGSWSGIQQGGVASPAMRHSRQSKVVTGPGTQTWAVTLGAAADFNAGWLQISETNPLASNTTNGFFLLGK